MTLAELIRQDALKESELTPEVKEVLTKGIYKSLKAGGHYTLDIHDDLAATRVDRYKDSKGEPYAIVRIAKKDELPLKEWLTSQGLRYKAIYGARGIHLIGYEVTL